MPRADSGRIIIGTWWLVILVISTTYCGNLVAFLTFPKIDVPITTVSELVTNEGTVTWGMRSGTYLEDYMKETDITKYQHLYKGSIFHQDESESIIEMVRQGKHVYIDWKTNLVILRQIYIFVNLQIFIFAS